MTIIEQINKDLYPEGRVYWEDGKGWTSKLWKRLTTLGWSSKSSPAGLKIAVTPEGQEIHTCHLSRPFFLIDVAKLMR